MVLLRTKRMATNTRTIVLPCTTRAHARLLIHNIRRTLMVQSVYARHVWSRTMDSRTLQACKPGSCEALLIVDGADTACTHQDVFGVEFFSHCSPRAPFSTLMLCSYSYLGSPRSQVQKPKGPKAPLLSVSMIDRVQWACVTTPRACRYAWRNYPGLRSRSADNEDCTEVMRLCSMRPRLGWWEKRPMSPQVGLFSTDYS